MKKLRRIRVYEKPGKSNLVHLQNKKGVYLIYENSTLVYVGYSQYNLYKTISRHFQSWSDREQYRVSYAGQTSSNTYEVKVILTKKSEAYNLEQALIWRYKPRDNSNKVEAIKQSRYDRIMAKMETAETTTIKDTPGLTELDIDVPF